MENAADALKIAGSVLLFIIALSVAIVSYGKVRYSADAILEIQDKENEYIDGNFYYETGTDLSRTVSLETIIPAIYRVYYENYRIVFKFENGDTAPIYTNISNGQNEERTSLDLSYETNIAHGNSREKINLLLNAIVYGKDKVDQSEFEKYYNGKIQLPTTPLIERLKGSTEIKEYLGVYNMESNPNIPESNKMKKRIITYKIK